MRKAMTGISLLLCGVIAGGCSRAEAEITERNGVKIVSNSKEGVEAKGPGESLRTIWTVGAQSRPGAPSFEAALWAETDPQGNVYVLDHATQKVTKLGPDGRVVAELGGRGEAAGRLSKTRRFAWVDGRLYFANNGNGRIEVMTDEGEPLPPVELAEVKAPGELFFANGKFVVTRLFVPNGSYAYVFDPQWKLVRELRKGDPISENLDVLRSHNNVCPAPDGVWIVSMLLNRIEKVGWDGRSILETSRGLDWKFPKDEKGRVIPEILVHRACAVDPAGNLYVVYSNPKNWKRGNEVYKFAPDGRLLRKAFELPILNATMIRFDRDGAFLYSDGRTVTKARIERGNA